MPPPLATEALYKTVQQYEVMLVVAGRRLWKRMAPADFDGSWSRLAPSLTFLTSGAQLAAAQAGVDYVPAVLAETGQPDNPLAAIRPRAFAGVASDGRSLSGLLEGSVVAAKRAMTRGLDGGDALLSGQKWLEQALQSAVADAARDATAASIAVRPEIGYVRMVNPPCCSRCAVLAGTVYHFAQPFLRHPRCDCLHIPTTMANADSFMASPAEIVRKGLVTDLSAAQQKRLADGANLPKVLNESRDRWRVQMAADRRAAGPVDALGRSRPQGWNGGGSNPPPPGTTIHQLMDKLRADVDRHNIARAMQSLGIAD